MDEPSSYRERAANPLRLRAHPDNPFLSGHYTEVERVFIFNDIVVLYHSGHFFNERQVQLGLKAEHPEPLTQLLAEDVRSLKEYSLPSRKSPLDL